MKFLYPKVLGFLAPTPTLAPVEIKNDAAAILNEAAHLLNEHGWCHGTYTKGTRICTVAAMYEAAGDLNLIHALSKAENKMAEQVGHWYIPEWNDSVLMFLLTPYFAKKRAMRNLRKAAKL